MRHEIGPGLPLNWLFPGAIKPEGRVLHSLGTSRQAISIGFGNSLLAISVVKEKTLEEKVLLQQESVYFLIFSYGFQRPNLQVFLDFRERPLWKVALRESFFLTRP